METPADERPGLLGQALAHAVSCHAFNVKFWGCLRFMVAFLNWIPRRGEQVDRRAAVVLARVGVDLGRLEAAVAE